MILFGRLKYTQPYTLFLSNNLSIYQSILTSDYPSTHYLTSQAIQLSFQYLIISLFIFFVFTSFKQF